MRLIPESLLYELMGRTGDMPQPGNNRWGKAQRLKGGSSYTFVNTEMLPMVTPMALSISFSLDGINFSPVVPLAFGGVIGVTLMKAVDVKAGAFNESFALNPGEAMPFCSLIAKALTVSIDNTSEAAPDIWVHAVACPTEMIDCGSVTVGADTSWTDVVSVSFAANTIGNFIALDASNGARQVIVQNNTSVPLYLGFGSFIPSPGPPPFSNLILPGGINAVWESQLNAFKGTIRGAFGPGGSGTEFATFTRGVS